MNSSSLYLPVTVQLASTALTSDEITELIADAGGLEPEMAEIALAPDPPRSSELAAKKQLSQILLTPSDIAETFKARADKYQRALKKSQSKFSKNAVHDFRVASRRLLAQFALIGVVCSDSQLNKAERQVKKQLGALSALRDTQVILSFLSRRHKNYPSIGRLIHGAERQERRLIKSAAREIRRVRLKKLGRWINSILTELSALPATVRRCRQFTDAVLRGIAHAHADTLQRRNAIDPAIPGTIHRTRIAFKKFRYMMEAVSPKLPAVTPELLARLSVYQRRMGTLHDLEVIEHYVTRFAHKHRRAAARLKSFRQLLSRCRHRTQETILNSADDILDFWPLEAEVTGKGPKKRAVVSPGILTSRSEKSVKDTILALA